MSNEATPQEVFTRAVEEYLRRHGATDVQRGPEGFTLLVTLGDRGPIHVSLTNLFAESREIPPEHREGLFAHFFGAMFAESEDELRWAEAREHLRPAIRSAAFALDETCRVREGWLGRPLVPFLVETVVIDQPTRMLYVTTSQLESWGVSADEVFILARDNLSERGDRAVTQWLPDAPIFQVASGDSLESSRPLLPWFLPAFSEIVEGRPIVCMPHRDLCLVAGDADPAIVRRLAEIAEAEYRAASRCISPALYTTADDGALVPYRRDDVREVERGHRLLALAEYSEQKARLDAYHEREGIDVFVASHTLVDTGDEFVSYCSWAEDVDSLLPRCDHVVFGGREGWAFSVAWDDVARLCRDVWVARDDLAPLRMSTPRFPDLETLRALYRERSGIVDKGPPE